LVFRGGAAVTATRQFTFDELTGQTSSNLTRSLDVSFAGYTPVSVEDVEFTPATASYYTPNYNNDGYTHEYSRYRYTCIPVEYPNRGDYSYNHCFEGYVIIDHSISTENARNLIISGNTITYETDGAAHNTERMSGDCYPVIDVDGYSNVSVDARATNRHIISGSTYNYGKRVVSVTYRKNS